MPEAGVLRILHLHKEEFQVLSVHAIKGRKEVRPVIWPSGHMTTSIRVDVGVPQTTCTWTYRPKKKEGPVLLLPVLRWELLGLEMSTRHSCFWLDPPALHWQWNIGEYRYELFSESLVNSDLKPSGPELFLVREVLMTASISLWDISLLKFFYIILI